MKRLLQISCLLAVSLLLSANLNGQNPFKEKVGPMLDSIGMPYKTVGDNRYLVTYCEDNNCIPIYVELQKVFNDTTGLWWYVECFTFMFSDFNTNTPSKSVLQKISELNVSIPLGKFSLDYYNQTYSVYYCNDIWLGDLTSLNLNKNLYYAFLVASEKKSEFDVFKE